MRRDEALVQGPTAVLPGACYFSTDRAGFMQSEEQLSPELLPPPALGDDDAWDTRVRRHMVRNFDWKLAIFGHI